MAAVIEFGFNATPVFSGVDRLEQRLQTMDSRVARSGDGMLKGIEKSSGGATRSLGQVSMQVQDIAVQLQMGAKVSTVLAQQGSQILSAFGAGGAIAGGVLAIGGAFLSMMDASRKAFDEANKGQKTFLADLDKIVASGGYTELLGGLDGIASRMTAMQPVVKTNIDSLNEFFRLIGAESLAGPSFDQRFFQQEDILDQLAARQNAMTAQAIQAAQEQTRIAEVRARGENDIADEMEQQLKLAQEIARIGNMTGLSEEARSVLADEAKRKAEAQAAAKAHEKSRREMEAAAAAQERVDALKEEALPLADRIAKKREQIATEQATPIDPFGDPFALAAQKELKVLELQKQLNQLIHEEKQAAKEAANEQKRKADEMARAADDQAKRDEARKQLQEDMAIAKAKQEGDMDKAAKLQQQADLRRKTNDIMDATGLNKSQAKAAAWSLVGDSSVEAPGKSKIKSRLMGGPDQGPLSDRRPGSIKAHLMGGHLSDYEALQLGKTGTLGGLMGPSAVGMSAAQNAANASRADAPATDMISKFIAALKTEFGPVHAKQLVDALVAK